MLGLLVLAAAAALNGPIAYGADSRVWIVEDGGAEVQLPVGDASWPAWSPDGRRIAFTSVLRRGIFVANADGSGVRRVTTSPTIDLQPAWSPDGTRLAFARIIQREREEIFVVGVNGKGLRRLTHNRVQDLEPDWAPNGKRIAFSRGNVTYTISPDGRFPRRLAPGGSPDWSPDGRSMLVARGGDIWSFPVDDPRRAVNLTRTPALEARPEWSPEGDMFAFISPQGDPRERFGVFTQAVDSPVQVEVGTRRGVDAPSWGPTPP